MLNLHVKLINQRHLREEELKRTITDLGATLVIVKKHKNYIKVQQRLLLLTMNQIIILRHRHQLKNQKH